MLKKIVAKIKEKKSLCNIDNKFVKTFLLEYLNRNPKLKRKLETSLLKQREEKQIIKGVRNELNKIYGIYWFSNELDLKSHCSTRERLMFYPTLYKKIFSVTGNPKSVLDLACGLNPLSYHYIPKPCKFIATEFTKADCELLRKYFAEAHIEGKVLQADLLTQKAFPKTDVCFLFKVLDVIETCNRGHKFAERLINTIPAKYIVVSFSTKTIHGREMVYPRRGWFERMLKRLNLKYGKIIEHGEIFYVVEKC